MHRFFDVPELVLNVTDHLRRKEDVYYFGATCRQVLRTVEDVLWGSTIDTMRLFCLWPRPEDVSLQPAGILPTSVKRRCGKVRILKLDEDKWYFLEGSSPNTLLRLRNPQYDPFKDALLFLCNGPTYSCLTDVRLTLSTGRAAQHTQEMFPHFPRSIECLKIVLRNPDTWRPERLIELVSSLGTLGPRLLLLNIQADRAGSARSRPVLPPDLCQRLELAYVQAFDGDSALIDVRSVVLRPLHDGSQLLPVLARLPSLLWLDILLVSSTEIPPLSLPHDAFPELIALLVDHATYPPQLLPFLESVASPALERVAFTAESRAQGSDVLQMLARRWPSTLSTVTIESLRVPNAPSADIFPIPMLLAPLRSLTRLAWLELNHESCLSLSTDDIEQLVDIFSDLEVLRLRMTRLPLDEYGDFRQPLTTRAALFLLASRLSRLRELCVSINFDLGNTDLDEYQMTTVTNSTVVTLDPFLSCCRHPDLTAALIFSIFPNLRRFRCESGHNMVDVKARLGLPARG